MDRVHDLEVEARGKSARIDRMSYAFEIAFSHWKDWVHLHPVEEGQSQRMLSRKMMIRIGVRSTAMPKSVACFISSLTALCI